MTFFRDKHICVKKKFSHSFSWIFVEKIVHMTPSWFLAAISIFSSNHNIPNFSTYHLVLQIVGELLKNLTFWIFDINKVNLRHL
jgi:presenilin-like A22 family membrane protease